MDEYSLWKKTLDEIALEVSPIAFDSFFQKTKTSHVENNTLYVTCPNDGVSFVLENKYRGIVETILKKYSGGVVLRAIFVPAEKTIPEGKTPMAPLFRNESVDILSRVQQSGISPILTFDNFAVSISNQMAHAASIAVSRGPGRTYNPLFIWGGVGVGKTHLLHAVGRKIIETTNMTVKYASTEEFTNALVEGIRTKNTNTFRRKFRNIDVLLLDDIQFVSQRDFIQEELFHTFNKLQSMNKQVIFTSDKPPKAIKNIEQRLVSRFLSGLVVDIQPPDFELKTAILLIKAQEKKLDISIEVAKTIAAHIEELRELEGFLLKLSSLKESNIEIKKETVERLLAQSSFINQSRINPKDVIVAVSKEMGVRVKDLKEDSRKKNIALSRHVAMYLLKTLTSLTYEEIAYLTGRKDHTTVMHGVQKIITTLSVNEDLRKTVERIKLYVS
ncbi:MAG: chromosomal replication initiator protein DnaA [Patescibacteria group bacterium]|jgi:chromosomal replication initiator protein